MPQSIQASCRKVLTYDDESSPREFKTPKKQKFRVQWIEPTVNGKRKRQVVIDLTMSPDTALYLTD